MNFQIFLGPDWVPTFGYKPEGITTSHVVFKVLSTRQKILLILLSNQIPAVYKILTYSERKSWWLEINNFL